jgi:LmbE family N-acetylglucosaminyl deacetylase
MPGWGLQHRENAFCGLPVEHAASRIAQFIDRYRPQVVVTYDPDSTGHPDHVHAARAATSAVDAGHVVAKLLLQGPRQQLLAATEQGVGRSGHPTGRPVRRNAAETARDTTTEMSTPEDDLFTGL